MISSAHNTESEQLFKCSNRLSDSYGIIAHIGAKCKNCEFRNATLKNIADIDVDFVRCDYYWKFIQAKATQEKDYTHLDGLMASIQEHNLNFLPILDYTIDDYRDVWNHIDEWGDYVDGVVERYREYNNYWEVWNEENHIGFWSGAKPSAEQYLRILKKASSIIRIKDPSSKVVLGGLAGIGIGYLDDLLKMGGNEYFDIVNIHYYNPHTGPEVIANELCKLKDLLEKYKIHKEVWLTETGYSTYPSSGKDLNNQVSEEQQAIWLPRTFLTAFSYGIEKVFWYCHRTDEQRNDREDYFGIVHKDLSPKPAYYAYKTLIQMCPDKSDRPTLLHEDGFYISFWKSNNGKKVWALWTSDTERVTTLSIKGKFKVYDIYGKEISNFDKAKAKITSSIIYIVGARDLKWKK